MAARGKATAAELEAGYSVTLLEKSVRSARKAGSAAVRAWAACLRKVFEVYPVLCKCGGEMKLVGVILDDRELGRILAHQGWPVNFPKPSPARAPPALAPDEDEADQTAHPEQWDDRQAWPSGDWPA